MAKNKQSDKDTPIEFSELELKELVKQAQNEIDIAFKFKQPVYELWHKVEDFYYRSKSDRQALKQEVNINIPIVKSFIDTMVGEVHSPILLNFAHSNDAKKPKAAKVTAAWNKISAPSKDAWNFKDLAGKKINLFQGRTIFKYFSTIVNGKYVSKLSPVDGYDFLIDPLAGGLSEENARYLGQRNILKYKYQLEKDESYNQEKVSLLLGSYPEDGEIVFDHDEKQSRLNRFAVVGLDPYVYNYSKEPVVNMTEWYTNFKGNRVVLLFDEKTGVAIKAKKLKSVFKYVEEETLQPLWPYASYAAHFDLFNFWTPPLGISPAEINTIQNIAMNALLENMIKRNRGQKIYDQKLFKNPALLEYRYNGLVPVDLRRAKLQSIQQGFQALETPPISGIGEIISFLDNFSGQKFGINAGTEGNSGEDKVGIYQGNQKQISKRLSIMNESFNQCYVKLGKLFYNGLRQNFTDKIMVEVIGEEGIGWEELTRDDVEAIGDYDLTITSSVSQLQKNLMEKEAKQKFLANETNNPLVSKKFILRKKAEEAGFDSTEISQLLDVQNDGNSKIMSKASQAVQDIIAGKKVELYRGANTAFYQYIIDFADENSDDLDQTQFIKLVNYAKAHVTIVQRNMVRKATLEKIARPMNPAGGNPNMNPNANPNPPASIPNGSLPGNELPKALQE